MSFFRRSAWEIQQLPRVTLWTFTYRLKQWGERRGAKYTLSYSGTREEAVRQFNRAIERVRGFGEVYEITGPTAVGGYEAPGGWWYQGYESHEAWLEAKRREYYRRR